MHKSVQIPKPRVINGVYMFVESEANNWLRLLAGLDPLPVDANAPIRLIHLSKLADRRDCHIKTIKRDVERTYGKLAGVTPPAAPAKRRVLKSG